MRYKNQTIHFSKLFKPVLLLALAIIVGVVGYSFLEGYSFLDALYMTVITISTVGYEVVKPLSATGKSFTIVLILVNIGLLTYFITLITRYLLDGKFIKRYKQIKMENSINNLRNHVIICGFGRNGKESAYILQQNNIPFVIIESKDDWKDEVNFTVQFFIKGN